EQFVKYIYPKLIFKTNPTMAVYGNDGSIYIPEKKEIYYLEAKFYNSLTEALNRAVDSLGKHNDDLYEDLNYSAELFRNIKTNRTHELIEITDDVTEKLIIFLICADTYQEAKVKEIIEKNYKVKKLKEKFEVLIFVLPILDKE
ncbi:Hachiman antiphage defense system protein HamA, partial [Listeria seeligeri]|uniref:Hachiman antiphage defense system protein HamA n=1 Tax=Listeria seeligeri TaxID=1640 RepID=UPI0006781B7F